jgi:hypothetical protein
MVTYLKGEGRKQILKTFAVVCVPANNYRLFFRVSQNEGNIFAFLKAFYLNIILSVFIIPSHHSKMPETAEQ